MTQLLLNSINEIKNYNSQEIKGSPTLKIGNKTYEVKVSLNGTVSVSRNLDHVKCRAFNAIADFFSRMFTTGEHATQTRANQLKDMIQDKIPNFSEELLLTESSTDLINQNRGTETDKNAAKLNNTPSKQVENKTITPENTEASNELDKSATTIQAAFREFLNIKNSKAPNELGFIKMTSYNPTARKEREDLTNTNKDDLNKTVNEDRVYYFDSNKKMPHLTSPDYSIEDGLKGQVKQVTDLDSQRIQLKYTPLKNSTFTFGDAKKQNALVKELSQFSSVCQTLFVEKNTLIGQNGGNEIFDQVIGEDLTYELKVFKTACEELDKMHQAGIYMKDIKPENMVFQEGVNGQDGVARHIDLDSVVTPSHGNYKELIYTDGYSTYELIIQRSNDNIETVKKGLKSNDQFAMLLTLMFATGGDNTEIADDINEFENIMGKTGGNLTDNYKEWIDHHVKDDYKKDVKNFLKDPAANPLKHPLHTMIEWESELISYN